VEGRKVRRCSVVVLTILLAFGLRMLYLQERPLWYDEAFAVLYAALSPARIIYGTVTRVGGAGAADVHPLLYYFFLHGWMRGAGQSPFAVRFLSVGLGMVTVALLGRLAAWCFDRRTGLAVGLLAAINPFHVAYSQEARMYALLGLTAVAAAWGLLRALEERSGICHSSFAHSPFIIRHSPFARCRWWLLYVAAAALTLYVHNLGSGVVLALNLLAAARRQWWRRLPVLALADLGVLVLFSPWLVGVLPGQIGFVGRGYWLSPPGMQEVVRTTMLAALTFYEPAPVWVLGVGLFTGLVLLALLTLRVWRTRSRAGWFVLLCWAPILLLLTASRWHPVYLERALLPSALFYVVALGWLLARGGLPRSLLLGLIALLVVTAAGSLGSHYTYVGFPRPPFQAAVDYLQARVKSAGTVIHTSKLTYFPMRVYAPDLPGGFLADPPGAPQDTLAYPTQEALGIFATPTITEAVGEAQNVWLVYFSREVEEVRAMGADHPALAWLESLFALVEQERFDDLVVALYRREGP